MVKSGNECKDSLEKLGVGGQGTMWVIGKPRYMPITQPCPRSPEG